MYKRLIIYIIIIVIIFIIYSIFNINVNENNIIFNNLKKKYTYNCIDILKIPIINSFYTTRYFYYINTKYFHYYNNNNELEKIHYYKSDFILEYYPNKNTIKQNKYPILILGRTISPSSKFSIYQSYLMIYLYKKYKINSIRLDFRGYNTNIKNYLSHYENGYDDIDYFINHISNEFNNKDMYLFGFSLSGNMFINLLDYKIFNNLNKKYINNNNYINLKNNNTNYINKIKGVILLSTPLNLNNFLKNSKKKTYNYPEKIILQFLQNYFTKNKDYIYKHPKLNKNNILNLKNMSNFTDFFNNYINVINDNKYNNINEWSSDYNILYKLKNINIPTLIIQSQDDFIFKYNSKYINLLKQNNNINMIVTKYGGHNGFFDNKKHLWYKDIIGDFLSITRKCIKNKNEG